jgi:hypothetical protein
MLRPEVNDMLDDVLIPEWTIEELERQHPIPQLDYVYEPGDSQYGPALRHYLTLEYLPDSAARVRGISELSRFYNRYYWFLMFQRLVERYHMFDELLERQSLDILEANPDGVDWNIVQEMHDRMDAQFGKSKG